MKTLPLTALALSAVSLAAAMSLAGSLAAQQAAAVERLITEDVLRAHVRFLSSDLLEGRGVGTRGDELARAYLASQMELNGLQPGAPEGSFMQPVPILGITSTVTETLRATDSAYPSRSHAASTARSAAA
jgi:hypothetical protein